MSETWTIKRMLDWMQGYLSEHGDENPLVSSRWLVSDVTGLSNMSLYTNLDRPLDASELDKLRGYVKRRAAGEPLQYIIGKAPFRHIEISVSQGVLIPRPETEVLVSEVLSRLPRYKYNVSDADGLPEGEAVNVADLCTGSGCIACSIAYEHPYAKVVATDVSQICVAQARANVTSLGLDDSVTVIECDLGEAVPEELVGHLDAVVSNPPYIPSAILPTLPEEVRFNEPELALDGGSDGLTAFRRISKWSRQALKPNGFLAVELHETTLDEAASIAVSDGYKETYIAKDLAGKPRVLVAVC